mmetsp:Transcript_46824/g.111438  ORF Transcript_46824/g.111438 Transcript_46824/m.111438 type:complete len:224 (-) Transcript_46824:259-930(-)
MRRESESSVALDPARIARAGRVRVRPFRLRCRLLGRSGARLARVVHPCVSASALIPQPRPRGTDERMVDARPLATGQGICAAHAPERLLARGVVVPRLPRPGCDHRHRLIVLRLRGVPRRVVERGAVHPGVGIGAVGAGQADIARERGALGAHDRRLGVRVHAREHAPLRDAPRRHLRERPGRHGEPRADSADVRDVVFVRVPEAQHAARAPGRAVVSGGTRV